MVVGKCARRVFHLEPLNAQRLDGVRDLAGNRFRRADIERTIFGLAFKGGTVGRWPAAFASDPVVKRFVARPELLARFGVRCGDMAGGMDAKRLRGAARLAVGAVVEVNERLEACGRAANDRHHHRQVVLHGADDPLVPADRPLLDELAKQERELRRRIGKPLWEPPPDYLLFE